MDLFAEVLAEPENAFASTLEKLALKKSSNNELYEYIGNEFKEKLKTPDFRSRNAEHVKNNENKKLDTSVDALRSKYKWLKNQWTAKTDRAKNGSGLDPDKEPKWYQLLNPIFSESHTPLNLSSSGKDAYSDSSDSSEEETAATDGTTKTKTNMKFLERKQKWYCRRIRKPKR